MKKTIDSLEKMEDLLSWVRLMPDQAHVYNDFESLNNTYSHYYFLVFLRELLEMKSTLYVSHVRPEKHNERKCQLFIDVSKTYQHLVANLFCDCRLVDSLTIKEAYECNLKKLHSENTINEGTFYLVNDIDYIVNNVQIFTHDQIVKYISLYIKVIFGFLNTKFREFKEHFDVLYNKIDQILML